MKIIFLQLRDSDGKEIWIRAERIESVRPLRSTGIEITMYSGEKFTCSENIKELSDVMKKTVEFHYGM